MHVCRNELRDAGGAAAAECQEPRGEQRAWGVQGRRCDLAVAPGHLPSFPRFEQGRESSPIPRGRLLTSAHLIILSTVR